MIRSRGCFPETKEGWEDYNKQYDVEKEDFEDEDFPDDETIKWNEEVGNNGEEIKNYPDEDRDYSQDYEHDPMEVYHQIKDLEE